MRGRATIIVLLDVPGSWNRLRFPLLGKNAISVTKELLVRECCFSMCSTISCDLQPCLRKLRILISKFSLDRQEDDNSPLIVGPALTDDNHVPADYLTTVSSVRGRTRGIPIIRPMMGGDSEPVMFTKVMRRPLGMAVNPSQPPLQLQAIQSLVEPWTDD